MAKIKKHGDRFEFTCPGCGDIHSVGSTWQFNGDLDRPTFSPSLLVRSGHFVSHHQPGDSCWCTYNEEQQAKGEIDAPFTCGVCHSWIRDGQIEFLNDCTHGLAGQTVELPDLSPSKK